LFQTANGFVCKAAARPKGNAGSLKNPVSLPRMALFPYLATCSNLIAHSATATPLRFNFFPLTPPKFTETSHNTTII
jgi:hypothetical protein